MIKSTHYKFLTNKRFRKTGATQTINQKKSKKLRIVEKNTPLIYNGIKTDHQKQLKKKSPQFKLIKNLKKIKAKILAAEKKSAKIMPIGINIQKQKHRH
jgi:hypothetical protein